MYIPTTFIPAKVRRLRISGRLPIDTRIPTLRIKIMPESNPLRSRVSVRRWAAAHPKPEPLSPKH